MTRRVRITQACLAGVALGSLVVGALPPRSYNKDLQQQYLSARALRDGIDVFTPVSELSARYLPATTDTFPHPGPHPPVLALLRPSRRGRRCGACSTSVSSNSSS